LREKRGGGYVLLHVGAAVERRDGAEEASGPLSGWTAEFPDIIEAGVFFQTPASKQD
jgi:hydrogenase maturation factor